MEKLFEEIKLLLKDLELPHLVKYVDDITSQIDKVHIAFIGEYNAGKSSLINTLLGQKVVAERDLPTTNRIVLVTHCPIEKKEKINPSTELICINDPKLEHIVLVDTPGASSAVKEHEETLLGYLHKADLVVVVAPSTQAYSKEIEELLKLLAEKHSTQLAYVINIFEAPDVYEEDPDKIKRLKEFVRERLREVLSSEDVDNTPIFAFSLRLIRKGDTNHPILTQEWEKFRRFIFEEIAEKAKRVKFAAIKEKLLKLLSGNELLDKRRKLENLEREREKWLQIKASTQNFASTVKNEKFSQIDEVLNELFYDLQKDVEEILAKYGSWEVIKNPSKVIEELEITIKGHFLENETLDRIKELLDYRPEFVRLKKIHPELVVEPTIPAGLDRLKEKLLKDIENLPYSAGKPGAVAKWVFPVALLVALGGGLLFALASQEDIKYLGIAIAAFGGIVALISLYKMLSARNQLYSRLTERVNNLRTYYSKTLKSYYNEQFTKKLNKVMDFIEGNIGRIKNSLDRLQKKLQRLEYLKEKLIKEA